MFLIITESGLFFMRGEGQLMLDKFSKSWVTEDPM